MATDSHQLLVCLRDYSESLRRSRLMMEDEFRALEHRLAQLAAVYEGTAADQFKDGWRRTSRVFQDYLETTARLDPLLRERIEHLARADAPGTLP